MAAKVTPDGGLLKQETEYLYESTRVDVPGGAAAPARARRRKALRHGRVYCVCVRPQPSQGHAGSYFARGALCVEALLVVRAADWRRWPGCWCARQSAAALARGMRPCQQHHQCSATTDKKSEKDKGGQVARRCK